MFLPHGLRLSSTHLPQPKICLAQATRFPEFLTIDRSLAAWRRRHSQSSVWISVGGPLLQPEGIKRGDVGFALAFSATSAPACGLAFLADGSNDRAGSCGNSRADRVAVGRRLSRRSTGRSFVWRVVRGIGSLPRCAPGFGRADRTAGGRPLTEVKR